MLFKVTHIKADGSMAKVQDIEAGSLYAAYKVYLEEHKDVDVMDLVNADDAKAVKAVSKKSVKEDKTMTTNTAKKTTKKANTKSTKKAEPKAEIKKTPVKTKKSEPKATEGVKAVFTLNEEHNGIEIKFNEKPGTEVRAQLKALKFRWHQTKGLWYAKQSEQTLALAKALCEAEPKAEPKAEVKAEVKAEEPKAEIKKPSRKGIESYKPRDGERICDRLIKALERTEGFKVELIKKYEDKPAWLWVSGDATREHKDTLKKLGFFWSGPKQAWYLSPEKVKSNYKSQFKSMDAVRAAAIA